MMKKLKYVVLAAVICCLVPAFAFAAEGYADPEAFDKAEVLHQMGLFSGTGTEEDGTPVYSLERTSTRAEAIVMLVKLLGKDEKAKSGSWEMPFTDVPAWAQPYVGYAYASGLTSGTGENTFGSDSAVTAAQYLTFTLRALGYQAGVDFAWDKAALMTDQLKLTTGQYQGSETLTRGDIVKISYQALQTKAKGYNTTLLKKLQDDKVFTGEQVSVFQKAAALTIFYDKPVIGKDGTITYSGKGSGEFRHLDVPQGQYYCFCIYEGAKTFRADLYYGDGELDYWIIGSLWEEGKYYAPLYR